MNGQTCSDDDTQIGCAGEMAVQGKVGRKRLAEEDNVGFHKAVARRTVWDRSRQDGGVHDIVGEGGAAFDAAVSGSGRQQLVSFLCNSFYATTTMMTSLIDASILFFFYNCTNVAKLP